MLEVYLYRADGLKDVIVIINACYLVGMEEA